MEKMGVCPFECILLCLESSESHEWRSQDSLVMWKNGLWRTLPEQARWLALALGEGAWHGELGCPAVVGCVEGQVLGLAAELHTNVCVPGAGVASILLYL